VPMVGRNILHMKLVDILYTDNFFVSFIMLIPLCKDEDWDAVFYYLNEFMYLYYSISCMSNLA